MRSNRSIGSTQGTATVLTNVDHQVNPSVLNGGQQMQFWDGGDMTGNGTVDGGSEFGVRFDKAFATSDGIFTLRSRVACAHDYHPDRSISATFQALLGASFVVNGAMQAADSALVTVSAEKNWLNGWSAAATFEGEFSNVTDTYAGKGVVGYGVVIGNFRGAVDQGQPGAIAGSQGA